MSLAGRFAGIFVGIFARTFGGAATFLLLAAAIFAASRALVRALPGDPLSTVMAESGTSLPEAELKRQLGLDRTFAAALAEDARRLFSRGDLGVSLVSGAPVAPLLARRLLLTMELAAAALALSFACSLPLGLASASRPGGKTDRFCTLYGAVCAALPMPWIGPVLILAFSVWIPLFPVGGNLAPPALALALSHSGLWSRLIRERVRATLGEGPALGARARGVPEGTIAWKYGLMPAAGSLAAYLGTQFGALLGGTMVVEAIFDWRGMGSLLVEAVLRRDYPVVEAGVFTAACCSLAGTALGDWLQRAIDPRTAEAAERARA